MSQVYLINLDTVNIYEDISNNVNPKRMALFVKKAQDLDLKPFLGQALYFDFIKWFSMTGDILVPSETMPNNYSQLFNGTTYADTHDHSIVFDGIIPSLVYWTFARFIEADAVRYTATGPVIKHHDDADAVEQKDIIKLANSQRSVANAHANEVDKFLWDNKDMFPLWRYNERNKTSRQPGARIRDIDRTKYNGVGYGYDNNGLGLNGFLG